MNAQRIASFLYYERLHFVFGHIRHHRFNHGVPVNKICVVMSCLRLIWENHVNLSSVCHFRGIFNVNLLTAHYDTNSTDRDEMIKACEA